MEIHLGYTDVTVNEIKILIQRWLKTWPDRAQIKNTYLNSFLKLLFIPVLFALSAYAMDYTDVHTLKAAMDPIVYKFSGVEGGMIGSCVKGTDRDPFEASTAIQQDVDLCLVYFVKDKALIAKLRAQYKLLRIQTPIAVRFQVARKGPTASDRS